MIMILSDTERYQDLDAGPELTFIQVPFGNLSRTGQIEMGHLFIAAKNLLNKNGRVISLFLYLKERL